jgi:hypothetical protein
MMKMKVGLKLLHLHLVFTDGDCSNPQMKRKCLIKIMNILK